MTGFPLKIQAELRLYAVGALLLASLGALAAFAAERPSVSGCNGHIVPSVSFQSPLVQLQNPVSAGEGTWVLDHRKTDRIDAANREEFKTGLRYGKFVKGKSEQFLFVSVYQGCTVPAFDGVIFKGGLAVANVSLKTSVGGFLDQAVKKAIGQIETAYRKQYAWESNLRPHVGAEWVDDAQRLFGVVLNRSIRPTRIVIDSQRYQIGPFEEKPTILRFREKIRGLGGFIESITIMHRTGVIEITADTEPKDLDSEPLDW